MTHFKQCLGAALSSMVVGLSTGCSAPLQVSVPLHSAPAEAALPSAPPHAQALTRDAVRSLLAAGEGETKIWGLSYAGTVMNAVGFFPDWGERWTPGAEYFWQWRSNGAGSGGAQFMQFLGWTVNWSHTGDGEFESLGRHVHMNDAGDTRDGRFLYTVPAGQVLVINEIQGSVAINGFSIGSSEREKVSYLFSGGQVVEFKLAPGGWAAGYEADPTIFAGVSTRLPK